MAVDMHCGAERPVETGRRVPSWFSVSVLWASVKSINREIRIPSKKLANALLRYMPRYEAGSALDLLPPL